MADYPSSIFAPATLTDGVDDVLASHQNLPNAEIVAIETAVGVNPTTIDDTVAPAAPSSVANFMDKIANIVKTISGSTTWTNAAAAAIMKSIGTTKGDLIAFTGSATPVRFAGSTTDGEVLTRGSTETAGIKWAALTVVGGYGTRGLIGANNSGTPNTIFDFSADLVVLRNPTSGSIVVQTSTSTFSNNVGTAGSTANGRDQAGAFSASSWIHFYYIWNSTTLATLSSAVAPPTGPTLPSGYTHWSYLCAIRFNGSSQLVPTKIKGNKAYYVTAVAVVAATTAINTETAVDISATIPPNAQNFYLTGYMYAQNDTVNVLIGAKIRFVSGSDYYLAQSIVPVANTFASPPVIVEVPNVGQNFYYLWTANAGTSSNPSQDVKLAYYSMPNGG